MNNTNAEDVKIHAVSPALTAIVAAAAAAAGFANALKLSAAVVATNASLDLFLGEFLTTLDCSISVTKALASDVSSFSNEKDDDDEELDIETATARRPLFEEVNAKCAFFSCSSSKGRFLRVCAFFENEDARVVVVVVFVVVRFVLAGSIDEDVFWMERIVIIMITIYSSVIVCVLLEKTKPN